MKKKVLHIVEAFGGGVYTFMEALANGICDEYEVTVAYARRNQTPEHFEQDFLPQIRFIEVKNFMRSINPVKDFKAMLELKKIVKEVNPDVIHLHSSKAGVLGRLAINCRKYKVYYTPHGYSFLKQDDSKLKRFIYEKIEWLSAKFGGTIVAVSKGEYEASLKLTKKACYINNGIDMDYLSKMLDKQVLSEEKPTIEPLKVGTIGRICYQKNPEFFNQVAKNFPDIPFVWVGEGEMRDCLDSPNIQITGWKERPETIKLLNEMDIFLLPSLWEGLPISLLEAMYLKKACIVTDVIGNRDVIVNGVNGFIGQNEEEFAAIIQKMLNKEIDLEEIGQAAFADVQREYNTKVMVQKYKELYSV
ncbi:MAG: glycosyltransferase family 4 protein [Lachnospiraceae bacterium]|nr:glycosyltransferase family 4 protein [Lachnospiraceae bacterium]